MAYRPGIEAHSRAQELDKKEDTSKVNPMHSEKGFENVHEDNFGESSSAPVKEVFDIQAIDPVLAKKMALVNEAIDAIGMTTFQWKMFFLNGFGYAVDSVNKLPCYSWNKWF